MIAAAAFLLLTYLLAAVPVGLALTTALADGPDLRLAGSGNLGATNVGRLYGWRLGSTAMAYDVAKGLVPVTVAGWTWPEAGTAWMGLVALTAFLGHCYPVYLGFFGGKGVATGAGGMLAIAPVPTGLALGGWLVLLAVSRRSSVASLGATIVLVAGMAWHQPEALPVGILLALGVAVRHVPNLQRLLVGREEAVVRSARWGKGETGLPDLEAVLGSGPAGVGTRAAPRWRSPT